MKTSIKYIFILHSIFSFSQTNDDAMQLHCFEKGIENLKIKDLNVAYNYFNSAYSKNPTNEIGKASLEKSDSLKNILRKNLYEKIKGKWKLIGSEPKQNYDLIEISENKIVFEYKNQIVKTEYLIFNDNSRYFKYFYEFRFNDDKTWQFYLQNNLLKLWNSGMKNENGEGFRYSCGGEELIFERTK